MMLLVLEMMSAVLVDVMIMIMVMMILTKTLLFQACQYGGARQH